MKALIVGSEGQDGKLLTDFLSKKGVQVLGVSENSSFQLGELTEVENLLGDYQPDHIYYLAAYNKSSEQKEPDSIHEFHNNYLVHCEYLLHFLNSIPRISPLSRLFYASSSLVFGIPSEKNDNDGIQKMNETSPLRPHCYYGITKAMGVSLCQMYREQNKVFAVSGFLFNHESELRKSNFLTAKIIQSAFKIKNHQLDVLKLGSLDTVVDWSHAQDFVEAFYLALSATYPKDYVIASGVGHTIRDFVKLVFELFDLAWEKYVVVDNHLLQRRTREVLGDPTMIQRELHWKPRYSFEEMVTDLVNKFKQKQNKE